MYVVLCDVLASEKPPTDDVVQAPTLDYESRLLLHFCRAQEHLINTYSALHALNCDVHEKNDASNAETLEEVIWLCPLLTKCFMHSYYQV